MKEKKIQDVFTLSIVKKGKDYYFENNYNFNYRDVEKDAEILIHLEAAVIFLKRILELTGTEVFYNNFKKTLEVNKYILKLNKAKNIKELFELIE